MPERIAPNVHFYPNLRLAMSRIVAVLAVLCLAASTKLVAQAPPVKPDPLPAFEVASIKPTKADEGNNTTHEDGRDGRVKITYSGTPLVWCIQRAYSVKEYQIIGPAYLKSRRYDIEAIGPDPSDDRNAGRLMMQSLLADRFQLKFHRETRELPVYTLVVGKNGSKIGDAKQEKGSDISGHNGHTTFRGVQMTDVADFITHYVDRPVLDRTGLAGRYDFDFSFSKDSQSAIPTPGGGAEIDSSGPSIFTAVQEQLGLKLKAEKAPVEVLVIDQALEPSEN